MAKKKRRGSNVIHLKSLKGPEEIEMNFLNLLEYFESKTGEDETLKLCFCLRRKAPETMLRTCSLSLMIWIRCFSCIASGGSRW